MLNTLPTRPVFFGLVLFAVVSMLFARVYLQGMLGLEACPLCMTQRLFVVLWGAIALIAALHNPVGWGRRLYALLCGLSAYLGAAVAARHVWLQNLPEGQVPACGPSLEYMLENFPFQQTLELLLLGDGNCAEVVWTFLGMSIPEQTLLVFIVALIICLWQAIRPNPNASNK